MELTAREADKPRLQRIAEISRNAMARMRDTVWAIDARQDRLENLLDRLREHAEETLSPKDIRFDIEVEKIDLKKNLPTRIRQNLYHIFKEAITNVVKHAQADEVKLRFTRTSSGVECSIQDNGKGLQKDYKTTGQGLANMRMRAEQIDADFEVQKEAGFRITLYMKTLS